MAQAAEVIPAVCFTTCSPSGWVDDYPGGGMLATFSPAPAEYTSWGLTEYADRLNDATIAPRTVLGQARQILQEAVVIPLSTA